MQKLFLFFMLVLLGSSTNVKAQEKKLTIRTGNSSLPTVLKEIEQKSRYNLLYSNDVVTDSMRVSIDALRRPVSEILFSILEPYDLSYSFRNNELIVIGRRSLQEQVPGQVKPIDAFSGIVVGEEGLPVAFATISLLRNDTVLSDRACSEQGSFTFEFPMQANINYKLTISSVGYQQRVISFVYPDTTKIKRIELLRLPNTLGKITVHANKPLIERKIDRLVFNLENSIAAQGTDVTEALRLTPLLKVTENNISIIGKGGVAVMINERMIHLNGPTLMSYLKSLRSDDIERIEVITTPPAKYEAQGNGGLINIVLKKNQSIGWSGNVSASYIQRTYGSHGLNTNLNYQSRRLSGSLKLREFNSTSIIHEQNDFESDHPILTIQERKTENTNIGVNFSINYKVSAKSDIGLIYDNGKSTNKTVSDLDATYRSNDLTDSLLNTTSRNSNVVGSQTLNLYYDQKLDSIGKKISTAVNVFTNTPETNNEFLTVSYPSVKATKIKTYSLVKFRIWSAQSDITLPYKKSTIEVGVKVNNFSNNADVRYYNFLQQHYVIDSSKSNLFEYDEKIVAAYISAVKQIDKKWSAKAGLRYEHANTQGFSPSTLIKTTTSYGNLFPTVYLSYKPNGKNTFALSYSRRIDRPYLRMVNPFRFYMNPYVYFTGNPLLQPATSNNLELSYLYKGTLSFTLYGNRINNGFGDLTSIENGFIINMPRNYLTQYSGGIITTLNIKLFPWWENSSVGSFNVSDSRSSIQNVVVKSGSGFSYSINNTFRIKSSLSSFLNYSHTLPSTQGNLHTYNQYYLTAGFRASLLEKKLQVGLSILKGSLVRYRIFFKDFSQYLNTDYDYKTLTLNVTYSFGKNKVVGNTKNINFGEKKRAN